MSLSFYPLKELENLLQQVFQALNCIKKSFG